VSILGPVLLILTIPYLVLGYPYHRGPVQPNLPGTDDLARTPAPAAKAMARARAFDVALVAIARRTRPLVSWWWGYAMAGSRPAMACYVCDQTIATLAADWTGGSTLQDALDVHRASHAQDVATWRADQ